MFTSNSPSFEVLHELLPDRGAKALTQVCKEEMSKVFLEKNIFLYFLLLLGFILESNGKN